VDFNHDNVTPTNTGQSVLVIDLQAFGDPAIFKSSLDHLVRDLRSSDRLPNVERIWLPGEQSHQRRLKYTAQGIPLSAPMLADLVALAADLNIAPLVTNQS
jgi:LDH2 family malate/lactate/ureidoglycolate dehydrogenase